MLIEELSGLESSYDRLSDVHAAALWNGRDVQLKSDLANYSHHFHRAVFSKEGVSLFLCENEKKTESSVSTEVNGKADSAGKSSVEGKVEYSRESSDSKGNSDKVSVQAKASVDDKGKASTEATVRYEKKF